MKNKIKILPIGFAFLFIFNPLLNNNFYARESNIKAPTITVPGFTLAIPDDMPSPYENLKDTYDNSKNDLTSQGWGENNYKDGLANKLEPPKGFQEYTAEDNFYATYGTEVMNENWADFGMSLYTEDKFQSQKSFVNKGYKDFTESSFNSKSGQLDAKPKDLDVTGNMLDIKNNNSAYKENNNSFTEIGKNMGVEYSADGTINAGDIYQHALDKMLENPNNWANETLTPFSDPDYQSGCASLK